MKNSKQQNFVHTLIPISIFLIFFSLLSKVSAETIDEQIEFGKNLMKMRDYNKAIDKFNLVLEKDKNQPDALFNKSLCNYNLFEYQLALNDLNRLVSIVPKVSDVFNLRGLTLMALKDTVKAFDDFNKAIELDKNFPEAYLNRGKALIFFNRNEDAIKDLKKSISLDSNIADSYFTKARAEHNLGKYKLAVDDFTNAMKSNYVNSDIFYRRGNSYFKDKDYLKAITDYTQVIYWEPLNPIAYNNRAFAYEALGDTLYAKQDRQMIDDIKLGASLDPEKTNMILYSNKDSNFSISLPDNFQMVDNSDKDSIKINFQPIDDFSKAHKLSLKLKIIPYYSKIFNLKEPAEVIEQWRVKQDSLGSDFWRYEITERVNKPYNTFPTLLDKILVQKDLKGVAAIKWNYGIAYGEHLIEINIDIPLPLYNYYSIIFQKTIDSFIFKKI